MTQRNIFLALLTLVGCLWSTAVSAQLPPRGDASYWRDSIPQPMRQSYIAYGEQFLGSSWTSLPLSVFAEYKTSGNRVNYEAASFAKRRQLAALVMAEIIEGQGRFLPDVINGLGSLCEETWWGLPAHYGTKVPRTADQNVDIFNAETAGMLAWTVYMLRGQLDAFSPLVAQRVEAEVQRRLLVPVLQTDYWWKHASMNWNPWICSGWLACVLLCETDSVRRSEALGQIGRCAQAFADAYPADGGCDEGPGYWDRAAASLFEVVCLLEQAGCQPPVSKSRLRTMGSYVYKTYIADDYCVNFADAHDNRMLQQVNVLYPFGLYVDDAVMRRFAAYIAQRKDLARHPAELFDASGNFPALGRELMLLSHITQLLAEMPQEPLLSDVWLPDLQIMTARRGSLFVAMKGGHNGESHNHNDVGHFIVYVTPADGTSAQPLIVDVGVGEYTSQTFSSGRYGIWTMQSAYHNLPLINGITQRDGAQYGARVVRHAPGLLELELAGAYPEEAGVDSWRRTVSINRRAVTVSEAYSLRQNRQPVCLMLMTPVEPRLLKEGCVQLAGRTVDYDPRQLTASVEDVSQLLDPLLQRVWGAHMYRIVLTVKSSALSGRLKYTVS